MLDEAFQKINHTILFKFDYIGFLVNFAKEETLYSLRNLTQKWNKT